MKACIKLYRDDGTPLKEHWCGRIELGEKQEIKLYRPGGPIIDNGMMVYAIQIQADVKLDSHMTPTAPAESAESAASDS